jgi:ankyrin repeat protein
VNATTDDGVPPICVAAQNGHLEVVKVLASLGADINGPISLG